MNSKFSISIFLPIILSLFISIFFIPFLTTTSNSLPLSSANFSNLTFSTNKLYSTSYSTNFIWPTPGYSKITSKFGYRAAPTNGASTYHGGIDIAAPQNSSIIAIADGIITYVGWLGANGYTIIIKHSNNIESTYGHISPFFLVSIGDVVKKGDLIARIGPKYIDKKSYTTYIDKTGKYTNGATTRSSFTSGYIKK
ncbi:MAG: M23 family metallopeptidase [Clostridia bacterium]|nr:M23 family metallopeptidase [Clostridia bacterium]